MIEICKDDTAEAFALLAMSSNAKRVRFEEMYAGYCSFSMSAALKNGHAKSTSNMTLMKVLLIWIS